MAHQQMLVLLQTVHGNVGDYKKTKKFTQEIAKLEAATLVICIATAKEASAKIQIVELFICK
jgi:hypothetical protein